MTVQEPRSARFDGDGNEELFVLQQTLYESRNPTRRWLHRSRRAWLVEAIERFGARARRAIEIGPGSGVYLPTLASVAEEVVGADVEDAYLRQLRGIEDDHGNVRLVHDDITRSSFPDDHFDLVLCSEVIEHIRDSRRALVEMHRVLRPGGVLILSTPQRFSPLEICSKVAFLPGVIDIVRRIYKEPVLETGHVNLMTRRALRAQLGDACFAIRETYAAGAYLPVIAELFGDRALRLERALDLRLRGSRFEWLLWTQFVVATAR